MEILTAFPAALIAGDTVTIDRVYGDVPTGAGWTVTLTLVSLDGSTVTATATEQGAAFRFALTAATSANLDTGAHTFAVTAAQSGARYTIERGTITVDGDPTSGTTGSTSALAHVERVIAACEARLEGKVTDDVQMYQLPDGITVSKLSLREVRELLAQYRVRKRRLLQGGRPFGVRETWYAAR